MLDGSDYSILLVDDEQFILDSLKGFLEDYDFSVFPANSAEEALELVKERTFDAGIIDLRLPSMSGEMLIQSIHNMRPEIRFIIHTGSVGYTLSEDLKSIGMKSEHVFFKPMADLTILVDAIISLIKKE